MKLHLRQYFDHYNFYLTLAAVFNGDVLMLSLLRIIKSIH